MKERPILFSTEMVKAVLEGRKTQTRRVIVPQPCGYDPVTDDGIIWEWHCDEHFDQEGHLAKCPYGTPGDLLYVRETWQPSIIHNGVITHVEFYENSTNEQQKLNKWRPSIHMPKKFARIWLRVVDVRVERVQDISYEDCIAETGAPSTYDLGGPEPYKRNMVGVFSFLWDSINAKRGYGWDANPWVWVVEFERVSHD